MLISVIIPAQTWDDFLVATIESLSRQRLTDGLELEIVVGLAGDSPVELPDQVSVVHNPSGTIPEGLNLAIQASRGEVIARVDARCIVADDHIIKVVAGLSDARVGCIGGAALVLDRGVFGSAYAVAFNSPMLGPSSYRFSRKSGPISSPYAAAWRRETLERAGGFDATLLRNQDNELADRVAELGLIVWYDANIVVGYTNNRSWYGSLKHHYEFGWWRMLRSSRGEKSLGRHKIMTLGVGAAIAAFFLVGLKSHKTRKHTMMSLIGLYLIATVTSYITAHRLRNSRLDIDDAEFDPVGALCAPVVAASLDAAWVAGLVAGIIKMKRISKLPHPMLR